MDFVSHPSRFLPPGILTASSYMLVRHPKAMEKVRAEISALGDAKSLTRDDLRNLKYLQNVLKEGEATGSLSCLATCSC